MTFDIDASLAEAHRLLDARYRYCRGDGVCVDCCERGVRMGQMAGSEIEPQCAHGISFYASCSPCYRTVSGPPCTLCQGLGYVYRSESRGGPPGARGMSGGSAWTVPCPAGCPPPILYGGSFGPILAK